MKKKAITISLTAMLITGLMMFTGCKRHGHHRGAEFMADYVGEVLDLDDSQKEALDNIKEELMEKAREMHADKAAMKEVLVAQLGKEQMEREELQKLIDQHRAHMDDIVNLGLDRLIAFHQTLTPDQKAKLVKKLEDFEKWHHKSWE